MMSWHLFEEKKTPEQHFNNIIIYILMFEIKNRFFFIKDCEDISLKNSDTYILVAFTSPSMFGIFPLNLLYLRSLK